MTKKLEGKIAVVTGGTDFTPLNSETFFLAPHFSCVLQNGHATANPAVRRRQGDLKNTLFGLLSLNRSISSVGSEARRALMLAMHFPYRKAFALDRIQTSSAFRSETVSSVHTPASWFCGDEAGLRIAVRRPC